MTYKKFKRSSKDQIACGVCGGLGNYFQIDPIIFRIIFIVSTLWFGIGGIPYLIILAITEEDDES